MQIEACDNRHAGADDSADSLQDLSLGVVEVLGDHGAMKIEVDGVEGRAIREILAEHGGSPFEGVTRHVGTRFGRTPQRRRQFLPRCARRLHEAGDRDVELGEDIEHRRPPGQSRPCVVLEEVLPSRAHRREGVGLVLEAGDCDFHESRAASWSCRGSG